MHTVSKMALYIAAFFAASEVGAAWKDYRPASIQAVIAGSPLDKATDYEVVPDGLPFTALVRFTGNRRLITHEERTLIEMWVKSGGRKSEYASMYNEAMEFAESGNRYWIPVQDVLIPHLYKELKPGDLVNIYAVYAGKTKTGWVFMLTEFDTP